MAEQAGLEQRVAELEAQVARLSQGRLSGVRRRSLRGIGKLPFFELAVGPDPEKGERRGHAKAVLAIGDIATGVVAIGGLARGLVAIGGLAVGVVGVGGVALGLALALGGLAIGGAAVGGGAIGGVAIGGGAGGYFACGGGALGAHAVDALRQDPEAVELFRRYGLGGLCGPVQRRPDR